MMNAYVGHPLSDVALRFGPPTANVDMGGGRMAFQWEHFGVGPALGIATQAQAGGQVLYLAPQAQQTQCSVSIETMPTVENASPADLANWIVQGWQYTGSGCV